AAPHRNRKGRRRRSAAGDDPADGVPAELRAYDREPAPHAQSDSVELPETDEASCLAYQCERRPVPRELAERSPGGEDRDEARQQQVERDAGDENQQPRPCVALPRERSGGL